MKSFKIDLYSVKCTRSSDGFNVLHVAADNGFTSLTKRILDSSFSRLLWVQDTSSRYPVEIALEKHHYCTASLMIREMDDRYEVEYYNTVTNIMLFDTILAVHFVSVRTSSSTQESNFKIFCSLS